MQGGKCQSPDDQPSSNAKIQMPNKAQMPECQTKRRDKRRPYYPVLGLRSGFGKPHLRDLVCQGSAQFQISTNSSFEQGENVVTEFVEFLEFVEFVGFVGFQWRDGGDS